MDSMNDNGDYVNVRVGGSDVCGSLTWSSQNGQVIGSSHSHLKYGNKHARYDHDCSRFDQLELNKIIKEHPTYTLLSNNLPQSWSSNSCPWCPTSKTFSSGPEGRLAEWLPIQHLPGSCFQIGQKRPAPCVWSESASAPVTNMQKYSKITILGASTRLKSCFAPARCCSAADCAQTRAMLRTPPGALEAWHHLAPVQCDDPSPHPESRPNATGGSGL